MKPQVFDDFNALELALYYKGEQKTLKVENNVFNSTQIDVMISSGSVTAGEKYYYNGEVYTVIGVQEVQWQRRRKEMVKWHSQLVI